MPKNKLSIYLIKDSITSIDDIFIDGCQVMKTFDHQIVAYYKPSYVNPPDWMGSFFGVEQHDLKQANARVALLIPLEIENVRHLFILTFGRGKYLLKEDVLEEQFGLKVLLNSVEKNELRKIVKVNIGGNQKSSQEQIPKNSDILEFGFDIDRDLIRTISAKTQEEVFEKGMLTGGSLFSVTVERDITNIIEFLNVCFRKYCEDRYKQNFDWLDNIKEVKSKSLRNALDDALLNVINTRQYHLVYMAVPEVVNWENIKYFKFSGNRRDKYMDLCIEKFVLLFDNQSIPSIEKLKAKKVYAVSAIDEHDEAYGWSAYKCFFAEIEYVGKSYCFNGGKWYNIHEDFVKTVNQGYQGIPIAPVTLCGYDFNNPDYNEDDYNLNLHQSFNGSALLHKKGIYYGGGTGNNIEVCDVMTTDKYLIHVKHRGGSSDLSHLFNQAAVSGEALLDIDFQKKLGEKLESLGAQQLLDNPFSPLNYKIILAIITDKTDERPHIPFFSKVSIRYAIRTLSNLGYTVMIKNIPPQN